MDLHKNLEIYDITGLLICQWPTINWEKIDKLAGINVWASKIWPIDPFA
jgi:hypothetical protein